MLPFAIAPASVAGLVVALSFAAGLNVYATVFAVGLMGRLQWIPLPPGLHPLQSSWVIAAAGTLFALEFVADKIPGFDVLWNILHTFIRIPVAALMAYAAGSQLSPEMHVLVTALGAAIAAIAHTSKTAARVAVTPSPEPVSNIALSSTEDAAAVALTWFATHHPLATGAVVAVVSLAALASTWWIARRLTVAVQRMMHRPLWPAGTLASGKATLSPNI